MVTQRYQQYYLQNLYLVPITTMIEEDLESRLLKDIKELKSILELPDDYNLPIFIDEAQLFCPNEHNLLSNRLTVTRYNTPRNNDLFSLILDAYKVLNGNQLFVTGTAFSSNVLEQLHSCAAKQENDTINVMIGQNLIETIDDFRTKLKHYYEK